MLRRSLFVFLMPMLLIACHPKEAVISEAPKGDLAAEDGVKEEARLVCPLFSILNDGQCLCDDAPLKLGDAQSWTCLYDAWLCSTVGGCQHGDAVCGFGGKLRDDLCTCMDEAPKETLLGDYLCQNGFWVCDKEQGCGEGEKACAYGETGFAHVAHCFGVELKEDVAKYRCEDKRWTCRHTKGCGCGGALISFGTHCMEGKAFCGDLPKPERGNYACVGACVPGLTRSNYRWICQDSAGCPCADGGCGFGASCDNGACRCGEDKAPDALKQYRCYTDLRVGMTDDKVESLDYWICNDERGCFCGDARCTMGERCMPDKKCAQRDPNRPTYYEDFKYENGAWMCRKSEGCRCAKTRCGLGQFCDQGQCSCDDDHDCTQSVCSDGKCREALSCGSSDAPKRPGYLCENGAWICRNKLGCFCGDVANGQGTECRKGKVLCGNPDNLPPQHAETYVCDNAQWVCNNRGGCICGARFAPSGSSCRDGNVYCDDKPVENGIGYRCEDVDGQAELVCGYEFKSSALAEGQASACGCGDNACSSGTICKDGHCICGGSVVPFAADAQGYLCQSGAFICASRSCKCGESGCGYRGRCENDRCVCGPNGKVAPKDATSYACYHHDDDVTFVCNAEKGCRCGRSFCGRGGVCTDDTSCRCDGVLAPSEHPEKYICHDDLEVWTCNDQQGCPFLGDICPKGSLLKDDRCIEPGELVKDDYRADIGEADDDAVQNAFCGQDKRPLVGDYSCETQGVFELGGAERSGWTCTQPGGCPCGDEANADICRSSCMRSDGHGHCLEYAWLAQYLPICYGPQGVGGDDQYFDASENFCNGLETPSSPGYSCDKRAWICNDALCVCRLSLWPKGHYCIDDGFYIP